MLAAVPWLRDFKRRRTRGRTTEVQAKGSLRPLLRRLIERDENWLAAAKLGDLWFTLSGLLLIAISFAIGFILALSEG
ncbi:MAG: hypothetical protein ACJ8ER_17010 [Allosphingosinicella sp.]